MWNMPFGKISLIRLAGPAVCWESTARQLIPFVAFPGSTGRETGKILEKNLIQRAEEFSLRYQVALSPQERVPVSEEAPAGSAGEAADPAGTRGKRVVSNPAPDTGPA